MTDKEKIERIKSEIERQIEENKQYATTNQMYHVGVRTVCKNLLNFIDSLDDVPDDALIEKRKSECMFRGVDKNGVYCKRYSGHLLSCDGRCSWIVDCINTKYGNC